MNNKIVNINVKNLYPHPDNPRKNIGDVTELADSIKKSGIMQNLTVIPLSALQTEADMQPEADEISVSEQFYVLIGHRRQAAASLAGLEEVPCKIVSKISRKEQVSIMLEENMQREDLTIYEQAQGFQMMLDLGDTEESIAAKTGFSKTTIRRRLNIAKLDQEVLKEKQDNDGFQLSLTDLYALEKIEDIETRNKILAESNSSRDIVWKAQNAVSNAKREQIAEEITKMLVEENISKAPEDANLYSGKWLRVHSYNLEEKAPEKIEFDKPDGIPLFYMKQYREIVVIKTNDKKKEETEDDLKKKECDRKKKELEAVVKEMDARRKEFIENIISGKISAVKEEETIKEHLWKALLAIGTSVYDYCMIEFFTDKSSYELSKEEKQQFNEKLEKCSMLHQMLISLHRSMKLAGDVVDYGGNFNKENANKLLTGYEILKKYGWSFEGAETAVLDGSHEFYARKTV